MKLIVGLGNPASEYSGTRHSVGHLVVDKLRELKFPKGVIAEKSDRFMNESGVYVKNLVDRRKLDLSDLYVIHDDLDIPIGFYKIQFGRGPKDHNGIKSIDEALGTDQYWRVRVGIENRPERLGEPPFAEATRGEEYVLQNFSDEEMKVLNKVIQELCKKLVTSLQSTS